MTTTSIGEDAGTAGAPNRAATPEDLRLALRAATLAAQAIPVSVGGQTSSLTGVSFDLPIQADLSARTEKLGSYALIGLLVGVLPIALGGCEAFHQAHAVTLLRLKSRRRSAVSTGAETAGSAEPLVSACTLSRASASTAWLAA